MPRPQPIGDITRPQRANPTNLHDGRSSWYRIVRNSLGAEVYLYDDIGWTGVTAADFVGEFRAIGAQPIDLHINSGGGDVFDGVAIFNAIQAHPAPVTVYIDGIAASAASFIAMAGDKVIIAKHATMMIHDAQGGCLGDEAAMTEMAALLGKASNNIAGIYAGRSGTDVDGWRDAMRSTAWYSAQEAVDAGLADEVAAVPGRPSNTARPVATAVAPAPAIIPPAAVPVPAPFNANAFRDSLRKARA